MQYAIIRSKGKQYRVSEGQVLTVDNLSLEPGKTFLFDEVLLFASGDNVNIGKPTLSDIKVTGKVIGPKRGEKIRVSTFKSKVRYRRVKGFRSTMTEVRIEKIESGSSKPTKSVLKPVS